MASQGIFLPANSIRSSGGIAKAFACFRYDNSVTTTRAFFRTATLLLVVAVIVGGDLFLRSYKYYARVIDARLESGYLTSRAGIYAAPRIIQRKQRLAPASLIKALQRAGYAELEGSNVWSGTFRASGSAIEIRPHRAAGAPNVVKITFDDTGHVSNLVSDDSPVDHFELEPEALANDV